VKYISGVFFIIPKEVQMNEEQLYAMRHSLAHITAQAVQHLWPEAKFGVGPVVENGFYYDIDLGDTKISEADFKRIEKEMRGIINRDFSFERSEKPVDEAIDWAREAKQPYKEELLNDLKRAGTTIAKDLDSAELGLAAEGDAAVENDTFYTDGDFTDLCRGPHAESTGKVGAFKLMRVAGAYWRGKETNPQMQRLYGVAFATQEELDTHLKMLEEAEKRDHRKLGQDLDLFFISDSVGKGLPLMLPRGEKIKNILMTLMRQEEESRGYTYVATPVLTQEELYRRSGHADYYLENMYATAPDEEGNKFYIKPMNCPHHHMVFERLQPSYKDLPLRLSEHAGLYRYELSGTLTGLIRMRGPITQNDSHMYMTAAQVEKEFNDLLAFFKYIYEICGVKGYWYRLSLPDFTKGKYAGDPEKWKAASETIRKCLEQSGEPFVAVEDEAAFYGPKLDVQIKNVHGKEDSIATVQIDILVPERMGITYINDKGEKEYPVVIHKSIMGAFERFIGFMIEQTAGWFPFWMAPEQVRILTINDSVGDYVAEIKEIIAGIVLMKPVKYNELRFTVDDRNESLGKKIRAATAMKIPVQLIVGPKDQEAREVSVRTRSGEEKVALDGLGDYLRNL
jgi:threonyl-tRNA synthetase